MKKTKKLLTVLLAFCMVIVMMPSMAFGAEETKSDDIVILYTNDVHCNVDGNTGYAGLAAYKSDKLKETRYVTLVDAGDAIQGDLIGTLSKGEYIIDIMNEVGYDIAVPGNHEFDFGMDQFLSLVKKSKATYLSANFTDLRTGKTVFDPYVIKTYGETKVAFVGISTPETFTKSTPAYFQDANRNFIYGFQEGGTGSDLYKSVQSAVDAAKAAGADYVVAVGHLGIDEQSSPWRSTDVIANTTGIDVLIDGHSHSEIESQIVKAKDGKDVILTQTGTGLKNIGELTIKADGTVATKLVKDYTWKDSGIEAFVNGIKDNLSAVTSKVVGQAEVKLNDYDADGSRLVRNQEATVADFCADAYRAVTGAQIGLIQGGGVRAPIEKGTVTYGDLIRINPWSNMLVVVEASGQQILDALEHGARNCPGENGGFLQVSGLTYDIDTTIPSTVVTDDKGLFVKVSGERRVKNVKVGGEAIDPARTYTVASTAYILTQQGDGFTMFQGCNEITKESIADSAALMQYLEKDLKGTIGTAYEKVDGRIGIIKAYNSKDIENAIQQAEKDAVKAYKAAVARTTRITSAKVTSRKAISVKISGNSKASGFTYKIVSSKGKTVSTYSKTGTTYTSKKLAKGKYTVKVTPYTYVAGEKVYGKTVTKTVTVK
ncbi:MAG: bifunctional metallophosphatase/5'-nucleotidase [Emergencia sp.]